MSNLKPIPWTLSDGVLSVKLEAGMAVTLDETHSNFAAALAALRSKEFDLVPALVNISQHITKLGAGLISVCQGEVFYRGNPIANSLTDRILRMLQEGQQNLLPMVNFLENCMLNPNKDAQSRLFTFLEKSRLPLTPDGCFLAYRGVDENFMDKHTHTFDNSPGNIVKMDRKGCDENSNSCCSRGLHFCSLPYLGPEGNWAGGRDNLIVIKINPRDVVAIPYTYSDTKGRCCRFEVLRTWQDADSIKDLSKDAWDVSLVAETEEVTSPAIRAMLNLARISEAMEGFELKPVKTADVTFSDGSFDPEDSGSGEEYPDDYCDECGELTEDCLCEVDDEVIADLLGEVLPESLDPVIVLNAKVPKGEDERKALIADLYKLAVRANEPAFAFQTADRKTKGDLKVTPLGRVLLFNADTQRWVAWYDINLIK